MMCLWFRIEGFLNVTDFLYLYRSETKYRAGRPTESWKIVGADLSSQETTKQGDKWKEKQSAIPPNR